MRVALATTKFYQCTATIPAISISPVSPNSALLPLNIVQQFVATVNWDASNQGVSWSLTQNGGVCSPLCGTISPATAASGAPVTYTAPGALPSNANVTLNATSVADAGESANATVKLTSLTVKLIPTSLDFHCKISSLANAGTALLSITGINIKGSTTFSQTNNCPANMNPGSSCTITVLFNDTKNEAVSGAVSISDDGLDSPQQVTLTGQPKALDQLMRSRRDLIWRPRPSLPFRLPPDPIPWELTCSM